MPNKRFAQAVEIEFAGTGRQTVKTVQGAAQMLMDVRWPRSPVHRDATEICLKVLDGHRSVVEAETAFLDAARAARVLKD